jgi:hypothetical protein
MSNSGNKSLRRANKIRESSASTVVSLAISRVCRKRQHDQRQGEHKSNYAEYIYTPDENFLFLVTNNVIPLEEWYIDSGCSKHMTNQREWFETLTILMKMKVKETL